MEAMRLLLLHVGDVRDVGARDAWAWVGLGKGSPGGGPSRR